MVGKWRSRNIEAAGEQHHAESCRHFCCVRRPRLGGNSEGHHRQSSWSLPPRFSSSGRVHDGRRRARPDNPEGRGGPGGAVNVRRRGRLGRRPAARIRRRRRRLQLRGADAWERRRVQHEDLRRSLRDHRMCILVNVSVCVLAESSATSVHETMLRPALVRGFAGGRRGGDVRLEGPHERGTHPRTRQCWCHGEARARDTRTSCKGQPG